MKIIIELVFFLFALLTKKKDTEEHCKPTADDRKRTVACANIWFMILMAVFMHRRYSTSARRVY